MAVAIHLERCAKTFADGTRALGPLTLDIAAGETVILLGPSGCGKTTTLRLIAGLESPDAGGRVLFDNEDVTPLPIEKRGVGMVFQSYALFPNMTVAQNVGYGLRVRGIAGDAREKRVREMLELVDLTAFGPRRVDQLSGGQRQRVALARALAIEPRMLLLDEPFGALDAQVRRELRRWLRELHDQAGVTTVFVTHDQEEALDLADRVAILRDGELIQLGAPQALYDDPASAFVYAFLGPANVLPAVAAGGRVSVAGWTAPVPVDAPSGPVQLYFRPREVDFPPPGVAALTADVRSVAARGPDLKIDAVAAGTPVELLALTNAAPPGLFPGAQVRFAPTRFKLYAGAG